LIQVEMIHQRVEAIDAAREEVANDVAVGPAASSIVRSRPTHNDIAAEMAGCGKPLVKSGEMGKIAR
jgi:hypothetical protein